MLYRGPCATVAVLSVDMQAKLRLCMIYRIKLSVTVTMAMTVTVTVAVTVTVTVTIKDRKDTCMGFLREMCVYAVKKRARGVLSKDESEGIDTRVASATENALAMPGN